MIGLPKTRSSFLVCARFRTRSLSVCCESPVGYGLENLEDPYCLGFSSLLTEIDGGTGPFWISISSIFSKTQALELLAVLVGINSESFGTWTLT